MQSLFSKSTKLIILLVFMFTVYLVGYNSYPKNPDLPRTQKSNSKMDTSLKEFAHPNEPYKVLVVDGELNSVFVYDKGANEPMRYVNQFINPENVMWNDDATKVTITSRITSDQTTYIIDFATGEYVRSKGRDVFLESQKSKDMRVFETPVTWQGDILETEVLGYPESDKSQKVVEKYMIDSNTGEILH